MGNDTGGGGGTCSCCMRHCGNLPSALLCGRMNLATLGDLWGNGQWNSSSRLPHCLRAVGSGTPSVHYLTALTLPHCLGAARSGTPSVHCLAALGQWAVELLRHTAALPWGSGQWDSRSTLLHSLHSLGALSSGTVAAHCHNAWDTRQWNSFCTLLHCPGAVARLSQNLI